MKKEELQKKREDNENMKRRINKKCDGLTPTDDPRAMFVSLRPQKNNYQNERLEKEDVNQEEKNSVLKRNTSFFQQMAKTNFCYKGV